ncbi:PAS domain-containing hybrid sensor histidine kinase/response regulator [Cohnella kolymensis]|uniref:PAS domain-containing hybrid sensor histidine kinase/response regulator n=1 Tax=Cohnella kolymensis TaxID=1590652 RepID=UPI0006972F8D|nr:ATP-binding protein [Cohnella kolymensis]
MIKRITLPVYYVCFHLIVHAAWILLFWDQLELMKWGSSVLVLGACIFNFMCLLSLHRGVATHNKAFSLTMICALASFMLGVGAWIYNEMINHTLEPLEYLEDNLFLLCFLLYLMALIIKIRQMTNVMQSVQFCLNTLIMLFLTSVLFWVGLRHAHAWQFTRENTFNLVYFGEIKCMAFASVVLVFNHKPALLPKLATMALSGGACFILGNFGYSLFVLHNRPDYSVFDPLISLGLLLIGVAALMYKKVPAEDSTPRAQPRSPLSTIKLALPSMCIGALLIIYSLWIDLLEIKILVFLAVLLLMVRHVITLMENDAILKQLTRKRDQYSSLVENLSKVIFQVSPDLTWQFLNPAWTKITGYTLEESLGKDVFQWFNINIDKRKQRSLNDFLHVLNGKTWETKIRTKHSGLRWVQVQPQISLNASDDISGMSGIIIDISERKQMEESLIRAKEEAERANRSKSEFLSKMNHELRTPLNAITGFAELLAMSDLTEPQKQDVREITKAAQLLRHIMNDVMDLSRIENGDLALSLQPVEILPIVNNCIAHLQPMLLEKEIHLITDIPADFDKFIFADAVRLQQVISNLLSNAIKYNVNGGRIYLSCSTSQDRLRFVIRDTGIGIAPGQFKVIFEPFRRGRRQHDVEGSGVGLSIVKQLIELMDGRIGLSSELREGSSFWFELPLISSARSELHHQYVNLPTPESDAVLSKTVLYIEDNQPNVLLMKRYFSRFPNFRMLTAGTGELGLSLANRHVPDLILLDIQLPRMNGFQVFRQLQKHPVLHRIPVVAISASGMPGDIQAAHAHGLEHYLTKPIDFVSLRHLIQRYLLQPERGATRPWNC